MNKKLLTAFMMILLLGVSKTVFAERAIPIYPEIKVEYSKDIRSGGEYSKNSISLFNAAPASETSTDNDGYGREAIGKLSNGEELQKIYDKLLSGIKNFENEISIDTNLETYIDAETDSDEAAAREFIKKFIKKIANSVTQAILSDNPDLFWFGRYDSEYYYAYKEDGISYRTLFSTDGIKIENITFYPNYNTDKGKVSEMQAEMEAAAKKFIAQANITADMSDYNKALALHDVVCANLVYDQTQSQEWIHTAYGAFVKKLAVCDGYSKTYQYLLDKVGIKAHMAVGNSRGEGHAWNLVSLDNNWYYTDVTWDDSEDELFYVYLNITTDQLKTDHYIDESDYSMPECTATACNYFVMNKDEPWCINSNNDINDVFVNYLLSQVKDIGYIRVYCRSDLKNAVVEKYEEAIRKYIEEYLGKYANNGSTEIGCSYGWREAKALDEYHFRLGEWYTNIYKNNNGEMQFNGKLNSNVNFIQACYNKDGVLIYQNILYEKMDGISKAIVFDQGIPDNIKAAVKETKYLLWRSGTMRPVCDIKKAS